MKDKKVWVGLHNNAELEFASMKLGAELKGYEFEGVSSLSEMLIRAASKEHCRYWMDVNLDKPGIADAEPARQVYDIVRERVEKNEAKFLAVSCTLEAIEFAREMGIPAESKLAVNFNEFLK